MKNVIKAVVVLLFAVLPAVAFAQMSKLPQRLELVTVDLELGDQDSFLSTQENMEVFNMPKDGVNHYYLSVGHLGIGDDIVQFNIDPIFELFIPIGDTVAESLETLKGLQALFKGPKNQSIEIEGCLAAAFPNDNLEKVTVTFQKVLLTKMLAFSVQRGEYTRATHIPKSQFNSLVTSLKFYRKIHPKEL